MRVVNGLHTSLETLEMGLPILVGTALFLLLAALPVIVAVELLRAGRLLPAAIGLSLFVALPVLLVRELRRGKAGLACGIMAIAWIACVGYAAMELFL